jgi:DNA-binding transcriptional regulator YhcF (GntR family)
MPESGKRQKSAPTGSGTETTTSAFYRLCTCEHIDGFRWIIVPRRRTGELAMLTRRDATILASERPFNNLLRRLNDADFALVAPHLFSAEAKPSELLYSPGDDVETVHFPCGPSLASYMVPNEDGRDVETILIGREGAVGGIVSQGFLPAYTRIMVKFAGPFVRLPVGKLDAAKAKSRTLNNIFARYADCMLAQVFQSTACNAIHSIEQRTAKWIISAMERTDGEEVVPLTHEQLATLLGVGRSYTSRVIQTFKAEGILETRRGSILVRNPDALRTRSCLCNEAVKGHFEEVLRGVYPDPQKGN